MKPIFILPWRLWWSINCLLLGFPTWGNKLEIDSLAQLWSSEKNDTMKMVYAERLCFLWAELNPDSAIYFSNQSLELARKLGFRLDEMFSLGILGYSWMNKGNYSRALRSALDAINIGHNKGYNEQLDPAKYPAPDDFTDRRLNAETQRLNILSHLHQYLGILYFNAANFAKSWYHSRMALQLADSTRSLSLASIANFNLARLYLAEGQKDSALLAEQSALNQAVKSKSWRYLGSIHYNLGRIYLALDSLNKAKEHLNQAIAASLDQGYYRGVIASYLLMVNPKIRPNADSTLALLNSALVVAEELNAPDLTQRMYQALVSYYREHYLVDSLVKYQQLMITLADSVNLAKQVQQFQNIDFDEQWRQQEIAAEKRRLKNLQVNTFAIIIVVSLLVIGIILYRSNEQNKKANRKTTEAYRQLQAAQAQLIYKEKMASLGELTAGIAHEIQNPLNFVNNFSEVNAELTDELLEAAQKEQLDEVKNLAQDIKQNQEKIALHGRRADAIVKNMLQHSRSNTGHKELTDINALCDEYLRLSYHGIRAKDAGFYAKYRAELDPAAGLIPLNAQDMGRVLLNLLNNAFYAVNQKAELNTSDYEPQVTIRTQRTPKEVIIRVEDNGGGIPEDLKPKIFQPFFTTKPTGQGTGLGLSLAYDIVTKEHGGELNVETEEGRGTKFVIVIPY